MESKKLNAAQLFLRIALSASFLSAVADRFAMWGNPGSQNVAWGNWENFLQYSNSVNRFLPEAIATPLAGIATALEVILALLLLIGFKTRIAAFASGILLGSFALAMTFSFGVKAPLDYSVFTGSAAALLLAGSQRYAYSLDAVTGK